MALHSDTAWFGPKWLEQTIHFEDPSSSWKIIQILQEHESRFSQDEYVSSGFYSESCCIFVCEETGSSNQAMMKVRMQYMYPIPILKPEREICGRTLHEIKALKILTGAKCSSTPKYIASKHENQNCHGCVPGRFLDYIVMERLEGITLSRDYLRGFRPDEQQNICLAFKASYE
ncbi:hypothetical protein BO71DRAFT_332661 [Aspergillus ellipticus CBS 707.79]|uniref:Aminoglycoside phosphotransferase domain-containing protein n=1 Tax=Aspergillus ellipticus CBS 707.79 TaxID=1448320 RepID=A0A319D155_9EURO|nr:hypothetical protein BO71DRAFT_332661 [Aspergillus ellipticus CBS 707.79]